MTMKTKIFILYGIFTCIITLATSCDTELHTDEEYFSSTVSDALKSSKTDAKLLVLSTERNLCMKLMGDIVKERDSTGGISLYANKVNRNVFTVQKKIDSIGKLNLISLPDTVFDNRISRLNSIEIEKMPVFYCENMIELISSEIKDLEDIRQKTKNVHMKNSLRSTTQKLRALLIKTKQELELNKKKK
jgi:hypothetical protein